jgi:hypothetical protein
MAGVKSAAAHAADLRRNLAMFMAGLVSPVEGKAVATAIRREIVSREFVREVVAQLMGQAGLDRRNSRPPSRFISGELRATTPSRRSPRLAR